MSRVDYLLQRYRNVVLEVFRQEYRILLHLDLNISNVLVFHMDSMHRFLRLIQVLVFVFLYIEDEGLPNSKKKRLL
jgi:hypothetical protein